MVAKIHKLKRKAIITYFQTYPGMTNIAIAKDVGVSSKTVDRIRIEWNDAFDMDFIKTTGKSFIHKFGQTNDYWESQIDKLESYKDQQKALLKEKKTLIKQNPEGGYFTAKVDLEPADKSSILHELVVIEQAQAKMKDNILYVGSQGEARAIIKLIRNGDISAIK